MFMMRCIISSDPIQTAEPFLRPFLDFERILFRSLSSLGAAQYLLYLVCNLKREVYD